MSHSRYLAAINAVLRQTVLPEVQSGGAKDAVNNAISVLAALAANLEPPAPKVLTAIDISVLPTQLRTLAPATAAKISSADASVILPLSNPADDFALSTQALPLIRAGASWLATQRWTSDEALGRCARALLDWETGLRADAMARVRKAEQGLDQPAGSAGVADLSRSALEAYLQKRLGSAEVRVTEFRFLSGGRNRQTALFCVEGTSQVPAQLVVQREPPTAMTTLSGVAMQYAVLEKAHAAGLKVPRPVLLELSAHELGASFMITERVAGVSPVPSMDYWGKPPKSDKIAASLAQQFAQIHRIPIGTLQSVMQRYVDADKGQTWVSDIDSLEEQWGKLAQVPSMAVSAALAWLRAHAGCVDAVESIVHNDALLHNLLVENEEITAVLDWELAHIGHPFEDLGYVRPVIEQMTDWGRFLDAYVAGGGRRPTQEQIDFFTLRSILKLLIQVMYVRAAFDSGRANVPALAEIGASFLPKLIERLATQLNGILRSHP